MNLKVVIFFLFLVCSVGGWAAEITIFKNGQQVEKYNYLMALVSSGDKIIFSNGMAFEVVRPLGEGTSTKVFLVKHPSNGSLIALRIPLLNGSSSYYERPFSLTHYISETFNGEKILEELKIPRAKVFKRVYLPGEYIGVEYIDYQFSLETYFKNYYRLKNQETNDKLVEFAEKTFLLESIGDFFSAQIVWANGQWLLLDWTNKHKFAGVNSDRHVFSKIYREAPFLLFLRINEAILRKRFEHHSQKKETPRWMPKNRLLKNCMNLILSDVEQ